MITPKGKLLFVFVNGHEDEYPKGNKTGKYSAQLELTENDYNAVKDELTKIWQESSEYQDVVDTVEVMNPTMGIKKKKDKEGKLHYLLKAKVSRYKKDGTERTIAIKDGLNTLLDSSTPIYNGSEGRLMIYPKPFNVGANYGISLYLQEIQLTKASSGSTEEFPIEEDCEEEPF